MGGKVGKEATAVRMVDLPVGVFCSGVESVLLLPAFTLVQGKGYNSVMAVEVDTSWACSVSSVVHSPHWLRVCTCGSLLVLDLRNSFPCPCAGSDSPAHCVEGIIER